MIITVVCDVLGEENNGTTIASMNLIRYLKKKGHTVRVLCADADKEGLENYFVAPTLNLGKLINKYVEKAGVTLAKGDPSTIKRALDGADHVHLMLPFSLSMKTAKIAKEMNISTTAGFHMQAENFTSYVKLNKCGLLNKLVYKFIYSKVYKHVDAIHYPTEFIKAVFEKNIKKEPRGFIISNGVHDYVQRRETAKPEELKDKFVILTTGRYSSEKAQDVLIKAIKYSKYKDKIQLILGGQGVKQKYYEKLSKKLPIKPIMKFYSRTEIIDVLNYADIYIHPAEMELEGISCLEAIACGKLTIVSDSKLSATKGFAIDDKCVFKNRKPKHLASIIDYWIENPKEREKYEKLYLESSKTLNQDECMEQTEQMIIGIHNERKENDLLHGQY